MNPRKGHDLLAMLGKEDKSRPSNRIWILHGNWGALRLPDDKVASDLSNSWDQERNTALGAHMPSFWAVQDGLLLSNMPPWSIVRWRLNPAN